MGPPHWTTTTRRQPSGSPRLRVVWNPSDMMRHHPPLSTSFLHRLTGPRGTQGAFTALLVVLLAGVMLTVSAGAALAKTRGKKAFTVDNKPSMMTAGQQGIGSIQTLKDHDVTLTIQPKRVSTWIHKKYPHLKALRISLRNDSKKILLLEDFWTNGDSGDSVYMRYRQTVQPFYFTENTMLASLEEGPLMMALLPFVVPIDIIALPFYYLPLYFIVEGENRELAKQVRSFEGRPDEMMILPGATTTFTTLFSVSCCTKSINILNVELTYRLQGQEKSTTLAETFMVPVDFKKMKNGQYEVSWTSPAIADTLGVQL